MFRKMLRSKIHRARVTDSDLNYVGSITIDRDLLIAADILPYEKVQVVNINSGSRFETYVMEGDQGTICVNGAAARLAYPGDRIIIMAYGLFEQGNLKDYKPKIILLGETNKLLE